MRPYLNKWTNEWVNKWGEVRSTFNLSTSNFSLKNRHVVLCHHLICHPKRQRPSAWESRLRKAQRLMVFTDSSKLSGNRRLKNHTVVHSYLSTPQCSENVSVPWSFCSFTKSPSLLLSFIFSFFWIPSFGNNPTFLYLGFCALPGVHTP